MATLTPYAKVSRPRTGPHPPPASLLPPTLPFVGSEGHRAGGTPFRVPVLVLLLRLLLLLLLRLPLLLLLLLSLLRPAVALGCCA